MKVTDYLITSLRDQGVGHFFLDLGGLNDGFMPALTNTEGVRPIVAAFEGGAAYMADGYARASGGLGVCLGIGGPGILNMVTPLTAAMSDRTPVLAISGEVPRSWEGMGGFQDASGAAIDDISVLRKVTGLSVSMSAPAVVPHHLRHAVTLALTERMPAHISVPVDVQRADIDAPWRPLERELVSPEIADERSLAELAATLAKPDHQRIVMLAGPGVLYARGADQLRAFAERFDIPVATTLSGKGAIAETHPLALGVFGYGGSRWATDVILSAVVDVLIVIGSGLSQRDTLQWDPAMLPAKAMAHIDPDPLRIGRTWPVEHAVVANPATALDWLLQHADAGALDAGRAARREFVHAVCGGQPRILEPQDTTSAAVPMHPARVVTELREAFGDHTVLCVDSGAHRAWFAEYWDVRQVGTHFSLTNLGPMGGAIPLGIGVQLARPDQPVLVATGDGCMLMHGMELHTAAREGIPVIIAVMNNGAYGNIYYRAHAMGPGPERLTDIPGMDWVAFARSVGADGERVEQPGEIAGAVGRALAAPGPYLLDLHIDKTYPTPIGPWRKRQREWEDSE
ncbi:thiamine pyrophosphate-binding protein [Mycobacterium sp. CVI_P3]|uniref:acetolactate synthase n=1 Tax=Mycobacterium pinniadriaticum TaxID=2994102 RepID=A0ABT3SC66_9MYCO|nr:thiamine pyrophosphate-binding protein [Mycobacterium pinniadriaticum]MCX2929864.1 thiamine pyrophosphate-binding protein [Mycobacterium pinniadriaticum]MCX2936487.1 thiamine pyrophosphate-binding protein [Mycobacterium pinniadriaticum]